MEKELQAGKFFFETDLRSQFQWRRNMTFRVSGIKCSRAFQDGILKGRARGDSFGLIACVFGLHATHCWKSCAEEWKNLVDFV